MVPSDSQGPQEPSSLTGVFEKALHHPNGPQGHGGGQQGSPWNSPEKVNMVRQLRHSNLLMRGAHGEGGDLTATVGHAGNLQNPSQHKEKDFMAPKC